MKKYTVILVHPEGQTDGTLQTFIAHVTVGDFNGVVKAARREYTECTGDDYENVEAMIPLHIMKGHVEVLVPPPVIRKNKLLTNIDLLKIIESAAYGSFIDDADAYLKFVRALGELITEFGGGQVADVHFDNMEVKHEQYKVEFEPNDSLPSDGGIFKGFDTGVDWSRED